MDANKTGKFISELRREKNLTQAQLAEALFVSDKAISRWETGKGFPDINNLEAISKALGVSTSELLKGERFGDEITGKDVEEVAEGSLAVFKSAVKRTGTVNLLIGLLISLILITFVIVQLIAPMHIEGASNALYVETLSNGKIIAALNESASGCYIEDSSEPESDDATKLISCYDTLWYRWFGDKQQKYVVIGDEGSIDRVYYYPGASGEEGGGLGFDELIYESESASPTSYAGRMTLNRLVYNYWLLIGAMATVIGIVIYALFRKKRAGHTVLKIALLPLALTLSIAFSIFGRRNQIYEAPHYFVGIVLLTILIYALFLALKHRMTMKLREKVSAVE